MRHESLSITSAITSCPWFSPLARRPNSIFRSTSSTSRLRQACARMSNVRRAISVIAATSCGVAIFSRNDPFGRDQRIVVGVVFEKELDDPRHEQHSARDPGIAFYERSGRHAAGHDFQRNHVCAAHDHLVVVVVFAAVEIVRRQTAQVEQPEDARGRLRGQPAFAGDLVAARAVAGRNLIGLRDDELGGLTRGPRRAPWSCRERSRFPYSFVPSIHWLRHPVRASLPPVAGKVPKPSIRSASSRARAGAVPTCFARIEQPANLGRVDQRGQRPISRQAGARAGCPARARALPTIPSMHCESLRAALGGRRPSARASIMTASVPANGPYVRKFCGDPAFVDPQTFDRSPRERDDLVGAEQRFGQNRAPVRAVVERALQKVRGGILPGTSRVAEQQPRERVDALAQDRIAFERHCRTADLLAAERLAHFAELRAAENANVGRKLRERRAQPGEAGEQQVVEFTRVGLRADLASLQAEAFEHVDARSRPNARTVEQVFVRSGGPDRAAQTLGRQVLENEAQIRIVDQQILRVNGEAVAERRRFGRLQVREPHADEVGVLCESSRRRQRSSSCKLSPIHASASRSRYVSTVSSMSIEVAPRCSFPPPILACDAKTRISAIRSWWISRSISSAASMSIAVRVLAHIGEFGRVDTSPYAACASASATQTARHSRRRFSSEKSERSSARPYLHENGEA